MYRNQVTTSRMRRAQKAKQLLKELPGDYEPLQFLREEEVEHVDVVEIPSHREPVVFANFKFDENEPEIGLWAISMN